MKAPFSVKTDKSVVVHAGRNFAGGKSAVRELKTEAIRYIACKKTDSGVINGGGKRFALVLYSDLSD